MFGPTVYVIPVKHLQSSDDCEGVKKCVKHPRSPKQRGKKRQAGLVKVEREDSQLEEAAKHKYGTHNMTNGLETGRFFSSLHLLEHKHSTWRHAFTKHQLE